MQWHLSGRRILSQVSSSRTEHISSIASHLHHVLHAFQCTCISIKTEETVHTSIFPSAFKSLFIPFSCEIIDDVTETYKVLLCKILLHVPTLFGLSNRRFCLYCYQNAYVIHKHARIVHSMTMLTTFLGIGSISNWFIWNGSFVYLIWSLDE